MSYITKKKRSNNFVTPAVFLSVGITAAGMNATVASADTSTGWDINGNSSGNISDANSAIGSANSSASSTASSRADSVTSSAASVSGSSTIGWIDVYVDHTKLDDAIRDAISQGIDVVHDPSIVLEGDSVETAANTSSAKASYESQANYIKSVAAQYTLDISNYNATLDKNRADAANANAHMDALRSNLAAQGQTNILQSKTFSEEEFAKDTAAIQQSIADGKTLILANTAIENARTEQNSMTLYTTAAAQGHVKLQRETVTIANQAEADEYMAKLNEQYQELQDYLNNLSSQVGTIPEDQKPTYTLYDFVVDPEVQAKGTAPVTTYTYTAIPVVKPVKPSVNYHYYDIRSKPTGDAGWGNKDGETIIIGSNSNANGNKVAQAMKNQTVGIRTDNQPLPSQRWDKIQDLTIVTKLPKNVTFDMAASNTDPTNWTITYDEETNTVTQTATPAYLVQVNLNQDPNNSGSVGGTTGGEWKYEAPMVFFKLLNDNETYQASSTTIVNKEYMFVGEGIQIRTDSADPTKANSNSKYQNIDGKAVLPGSINNYILGWDFDQYKGVNIDSEMQKNGLHLVDDYPEEAVDLTGPISIVDPETGEVLYSTQIPEGTDLGSTGVFKDASGKEVPGFTWTVIDNDSAPENLKGKLNGKAIMISYTGTDNEFYKKYVEGGHSLNVVIPMTTKKIDNTPDKQGGSYNGNTYTNTAWQSDFGNEYKSNDVTNTAPKLDPNKDAVLSFSNLTSLDINKNPNSSIENGTYFQYRLGGSKLPNNLSEDLNSYVFTDELPVDADEYNGEFIVQTNTAIKFKEGSTLAKRYPNGIPAGSDISKYFTQTVQRNVSGSGMTPTGTTEGADTKVTRVELSADADFLSQIDYDNTNFHVDAFLTVKRIANVQQVRNVFDEVINGVDFGSTEVFTNSRKNAIDELKDKLESLNSAANSTSSAIDANKSDIANNSSAIASMNGALSIIIREIDTISSTASSAVSAVDSLSSQADAVSSAAKSNFDYTNSQVSSFAKSADSAINSIASSASKAIAANSGAIGSVASATSSQTSSMAKSISELINSLASATEQSLSQLTIYDPDVKTDADALSYAVNRGVAAGSIKSITLNANKKFVVTYNTSKTAINNSTEATPAAKPSLDNAIGLNTTTKTNQLKYVFYTLKSETEVYAKLKDMGYTANMVASLTRSGDVFTVFVNA